MRGRRRRSSAVPAGQGPQDLVCGPLSVVATAEPLTSGAKSTISSMQICVSRSGSDLEGNARCNYKCITGFRKSSVHGRSLDPLTDLLTAERSRSTCDVYGSRIPLLSSGDGPGRTAMDDLRGDWKSCEGKPSEGSNPSPSATFGLVKAVVAPLQGALTPGRRDGREPSMGANLLGGPPGQAVRTSAYRLRALATSQKDWARGTGRQPATTTRREELGNRYWQAPPLGYLHGFLKY